MKLSFRKFIIFPLLAVSILILLSFWFTNKKIDFTSKLEAASRFPFAVDLKNQVTYFKKKSEDYFIVERRALSGSKRLEEVYRGRSNPYSMHLAPTGDYLTMQTRDRDEGYRTYILNLIDKSKCELNLPPLKNALAPIRWSPSGKKLAFYHERFGQGGIGVLHGNWCDQKMQLFITRAALDSDFIWDSEEGSIIMARNSPEPFIEKIPLNHTSSLNFKLDLSEEIRFGEIARRGGGKQFTVQYVSKNSPYWKSLFCNEEKIECKEGMTPPGNFHFYSTQGGTLISHYRINPFSVSITGNRETSKNVAINRVIAVSDKEVFLHHQPYCSSGILYTTSFTDGRLTLPENPCPAPELVSLFPEDSDSSPLAFFRAPNQRGVLLIVDARSYSFSSPVWGSVIGDFLSKGISVLVMDYLEKKDWNWNPDLNKVFNERANKVKIALSHASAIAGESGMIGVFGASYAADLLYHSLEILPLHSATLLGLSSQSMEKKIHSLPSRLILFKGEFDEWNNSEKDFKTYKNFISKTQTKTVLKNTVLKGEAHTPQLTKSWNKIFIEILNSFN